MAERTAVAQQYRPLATRSGPTRLSSTASNQDLQYVNVHVHERSIGRSSFFVSFFCLARKQNTKKCCSYSKPSDPQQKYVLQTFSRVECGTKPSVSPSSLNPGRSKQRHMNCLLTPEVNTTQGRTCSSRLLCALCFTSTEQLMKHTHTHTHLRSNPRTKSWKVTWRLPIYVPFASHQPYSR